jgi:hypothetical protein
VRFVAGSLSEECSPAPEVRKIGHGFLEFALPTIDEGVKAVTHASHGIQQRIECCSLL